MYASIQSRCASWILFWIILALYGSIVSGQVAINLHCPNELAQGINLITCKVNTTQGSKEGCKFGGLIRFTLVQKDQSPVTVCGADFTECDQNFNGSRCRCVSDVDLKHYEFMFDADRSIHANAKLGCSVSCFPQALLSKYYTPSCDLLKFPVCHDGFYSQDCQLRCGNCSYGEACDHKDGLCPEGCMSGYKPPLCQERCDDGFYGNCANSCGQCADGQSCDKVTGACTSCLPGYKPPFCQECINGGCTNDALDVNATSTGESSSENEFPLDIVLISIGLVLLVGVIATALLVRHRRLTAQNSQLPGMPPPHSEPIPEIQNSQLAGTPSEPIPEEKHTPSVASSSDYSGSDSPHDSSDRSTSNSESMKSDIIEDQ